MNKTFTLLEDHGALMLHPGVVVGKCQCTATHYRGDTYTQGKTTVFAYMGYNVKKGFLWSPEGS